MAQHPPRPLLSSLHPALYELAVKAYRLRRHACWFYDDLRGVPIAHQQTKERLPVRIKRHQSRLLRKLGDSEMWLQHNKIKNLALAILPLDGLLIRPREKFSFWRRVGPPVRERGYIEGMEISRGEARPGVGGGICQCANVLHWLVLHSPFIVIERSVHSYDPFPDQARSIPYGTGCSVFYNYVDFQFYNPTDISFQLCLSLSERFLEADLRAAAPIAETYRIFETDHKFLRIKGAFYRKNTLWRQVMERATGRPLRVELIKHNFVRVKYAPAEFEEAGN